MGDQRRYHIGGAPASRCGYAMVLAAPAIGPGAVWRSTALGDGQDLRSVSAMADCEQLPRWMDVGGAIPWAPAGRLGGREAGISVSSTVLPARTQ